MQEIDNFDQKIDFIPNCIEKYMAFMFLKQLVFINSILFWVFSQKYWLKIYQKINLGICPKNFKKKKKKKRKKNRINKAKSNICIYGEKLPGKKAFPTL